MNSADPAWDSSLSNFNRLIGMKVLEWVDGAVTIAVDLEDHLRNRSGVLHGGVFMTTMDAAGGYAGCYCPEPGRVRKTATLSFNTNFLAPGLTGRILTRARVRGGGTKIYFASVEVVDERGSLLAMGEGSYRYLPGSESLAGVPIEANP